MTMTEFDQDFVLHFDNCPDKISHFVSLSFCVIFEIQCHFRRYIINKYKYLLYRALFSFKNENDTK